MTVAPKTRLELLTDIFEDITDYLLEQCPDMVNWEDFDGELDGMRTQAYELREEEYRNVAQPQQ